MSVTRWLAAEDHTRVPIGSDGIASVSSTSPARRSLGQAPRDWWGQRHRTRSRPLPFPQRTTPKEKLAGTIKARDRHRSRPWCMKPYC